MSDWRPTRAEIDLGAIRDNCRALRGLLGEGTLHLAVVKANAYGHGDIAVARACLEAGVDRLGVALVEEGVRLRDAGIEAPILVLVEPHPASAKEIVERGLTATVSTEPVADALADAARAGGTAVSVHVALDTGMHRDGADLDRATALVRHVAGQPGLILEGLWSHFAVADEPERAETVQQMERFAELCDRLDVDVPIRLPHRRRGGLAGDGGHLEAPAVPAPEPAHITLGDGSSHAVLLADGHEGRLGARLPAVLGTGIGRKLSTRLARCFDPSAAVPLGSSGDSAR